MKELTERMRIYIAGPMRGIAYYNFPAFDSARDAVTAAGHIAVNPADLDRAIGFDALKLSPSYDWNSIPAGFDLPQAIKRDLDALQQCEAILLLPGWDKSVGAMAECFVARWMGIKEVRL